MDFDLQALRETFFAGAAAHLARMEELLLAFESTAPTADELDEVFRGAHSLKGDAACVGFDGTAHLAHALEDLLDGVRSGRIPYAPELGALLLRGVDELRRVTTTGVDAPPDKGLLDAMGTAATAAPAPPIVSGPTAGSAHEPWAPVPADEPIALSPDPAPARAPAAPPDRAREQYLRVGVRLLDRVLSLTSGITVERARVRKLVDELPGEHRSALAEALDSVERLDRELQESVLAVRLVRLSELFRRHVRTVRDAARALGRQVELVIEAGEVEVDTAIADALTDPIVHLVRNAIAHGIESPDERLGAGKSATGTVTLRAAQTEGRITVEVTDDGRGIDRDAVHARAAALHLAQPDEKLDDERLCDVLCRPGFSTAGAVTELSGRGVGMDVVRRNVEGLRGSLALTTRPGRGTTFRLRLPLTLAIMDAFEVVAGGASYFVPIEAVDECLDLTREEDAAFSSLGLFQRDGTLAAFVHLRDLLGLPRATGGGAALLLQDHEARVALAVDALAGKRQIVVSSLGGLAPRGSIVSAATTLGDGSVGLILDPFSLVRATHQRAVGGPAIAHADGQPRHTPKDT